jgi:hypothetical protein
MPTSNFFHKPKKPFYLLEKDDINVRNNRNGERVYGVAKLSSSLLFLDGGA